MNMTLADEADLGDESDTIPPFQGNMHTVVHLLWLLIILFLCSGY